MAISYLPHDPVKDGSRGEQKTCAGGRLLSQPSAYPSHRTPTVILP
ncbi:hypothetical protein OAL32_03395 [Synechococcus sp. AH-551-G15]|nr:hypothetical protein [Synechococcus sp. AH-551-G15]